MTNILPPPDREQFEKRIDDLFERYHGSKDRFAQFLGKHPSLISKRLNPYNSDHISTFYRLVSEMAQLRLASPELAAEVWQEIKTEVDQLLLGSSATQESIAETLNKLHAKVGELLGAKMRGEKFPSLISITAELESQAKQAKEQFISIRNENHFNSEAVNR